MYQESNPAGRLNCQKWRKETKISEGTFHNYCSISLETFPMECLYLYKHLIVCLHTELEDKFIILVASRQAIPWASGWEFYIVIYRQMTETLGTVWAFQIQWHTSPIMIYLLKLPQILFLIIYPLSFLT